MLNCGTYTHSHIHSNKLTFMEILLNVIDKLSCDNEIWNENTKLILITMKWILFNTKYRCVANIIMLTCIVHK